MTVEEVGEDGNVRKTHELPFSYASCCRPSRRSAVRGLEGLTNPRGFILIDKHQRNPAFPNVFGIGVGVAIAPVGATPVPTGVPKTGFMIESMVTATALNIGALLRGEARRPADLECGMLGGFRRRRSRLRGPAADSAPNVNWSSKGDWVHYAKIAFEKYFLRKIWRGESEPFYERFVLDKLGIRKIKEPEAGGMPCSPYDTSSAAHLRRHQSAPRRQAGAGRTLRRLSRRLVRGPPGRGRDARFRQASPRQRHRGAGRRVGALVRAVPGMAPMFEQAAAELEPDVRLLKVNADEAPAFIALLGVSGIPALLLLRGGREISRKSGAMDAGSIVAWTLDGLART